MRILLADDQIDVRSGLKLLLEHQPEMEIVGEAGGISELLVQTQNIRPDLVLLDWELSNLRIGDILPVLRTLSPGLRIVAMSGRPESRKSAITAGVDGFVSKYDQPDKLLETINEIRVKGDENE